MYSVTSNAGELALLIGISGIVFLIQKDLALAGSFADFLHRSNKAFNKAVKSDSESVDEFNNAQSSNTPYDNGLELIVVNEEKSSDNALV